MLRTMFENKFLSRCISRGKKEEIATGPIKWLQQCPVKSGQNEY